MANSSASLTLLTISLTVVVHPFNKSCIHKDFDNLTTDGLQWVVSWRTLIDENGGQQVPAAAPGTKYQDIGAKIGRVGAAGRHECAQREAKGPEGEEGFIHDRWR